MKNKKPHYQSILTSQLNKLHVNAIPHACMWKRQRPHTLFYYLQAGWMLFSFQPNLCYLWSKVFASLSQVCFKPITWYIEMQPHKDIISVRHHDFLVLCDVFQEESLPRFLHLKIPLWICLILFYLQLINSGHADSSTAERKNGNLSSWR